MKQHNIQSGVIPAFLIAAGMCFGMPAHAQETHSGSGIERVFVVSKFESTNQRIPTAACMFVNSGHSDSVAPLLTSFITEFDKDLQVAYEGSEELGLPATEYNHRVFVRLDELKELWEPFPGAAEILVAGENTQESLAFISENNPAPLQATQILFTEVSTEYANPVLVTKSDVLLIEVFNRERMVTEKISKESCAVISGNAAAGSLEDLHKSIATFEAILGAFRNRMPSAVIAPAPTEQFDTQDHWSEVKALLYSDYAHTHF